MNYFELSVNGATTLDKDRLEAAFHMFLLNQRCLQSEDGDIHIVHFNDVSVGEFGSEDEKGY